jgi:plastocyanin
VTDERSAIVTMSNSCFVATITRVDAGATVTFVNEDDASHAVTGANFSWGMESVSKGDDMPDPYLTKGERFEWTFEDSGVYPYFCILHPSMVGALFVGDGQIAVAATEADTQSASLAVSGQRQPSSNDPAAATSAATDTGDDRSIVLQLTLLAAGVALLAGIVVFARTLAARRASAG